MLFTIPEDTLPSVRERLKAGAKLEVRVLDRAQKNELGIGKLDTHDNLIDMTTGTVKLRAVFDNKDDTLFPNQFVNVRLLVDTVKDATVVPVAAIQRGQPGTFVYLVKADDTVEIRVVELGATDGEKVQIVKGLQAGDQVVIDGTDRLRDGAKIRRPGGGPPRAASGPPIASAPEPSKAPASSSSRGDARPTAAVAPRRRGRPPSPTSNPDRDMNPSRLFIQRPVATSLLMVAIVLVGHRRLPVPAAVGAAAGRLSDHPGADALSRRQPRSDDLVGHRAAGAPVRPDAGPQPDDLDQLGRRLGRSRCSSTSARPRRRRAAGAGRDQRRRQPPAGRPAGAAGLRQGQPGRRAGADAGHHLQDRCR